jgi:hypothetical protein
VAKAEFDNGDVTSIILDMTLALLHMEDSIRLLSDQVPPLRQTDELRKSSAAIRKDMNSLVEKIEKLTREDA